MNIYYLSFSPNRPRPRRRKVSRRENVKAIPAFRDPEFPESTPESSPEKNRESGSGGLAADASTASAASCEPKRTTKEKCILAAAASASANASADEKSGRNDDVIGGESFSGVAAAPTATDVDIAGGNAASPKFTTANFTEAKVTAGVQSSVLLNVGRASQSSSPAPSQTRDNNNDSGGAADADHINVAAASSSTYDAAVAGKRRKSRDGSSDGSHTSSKRSKKRRKRKSEVHTREREGVSSGGGAFKDSEDEDVEEDEDEEGKTVPLKKDSKSSSSNASGGGVGDGDGEGGGGDGKVSQRELLSRLKPTSVVLNPLSSSAHHAIASFSSSSSRSSSTSTITASHRPTASFSSTPPLRSLSPATPPPALLPSELGSGVDFLAAPPRSSVLLCNSGVSVASASSSVTSLSR